MIDVEGFVGSQRGRRFRHAALVVAAGAMALACELIIGDPPKGEVPQSYGGSIGAGGTEQLNSGGRAALGGTSGGSPDVHFGGSRSEEPMPQGEGGASPMGGSAGSTSTENPPSGEGGAGGFAEGGAAGAPCMSEPTTWYRDDDGDGFGTNVTVFACRPPPGKWSNVPGDCNDDWPEVHPGQEKFFGTSFTKSDGTASFDYDCSGREDPNPSQTLAAKDCGALKLALCGDESGYVTNNRSGDGINPYCGSTIVRACVPSLLVCDTTERTTQPPFSCR